MKNSRRNPQASLMSPCNHVQANPKRDAIETHLADLVREQRETNKLLRLILSPLLSVEKSCVLIAERIAVIAESLLHYAREEERKAQESWLQETVRLVDLASMTSTLVAAPLSALRHSPLRTCYPVQRSLFWLPHTVTMSLGCVLFVSLRLFLGFSLLLCLWVLSFRRARDHNLTHHVPPKMAMSSFDAARVLFVRPFVLCQMISSLLVEGRAVYLLLGRLTLLALLLPRPSETTPVPKLQIIALSLLAGSVGFHIVYQVIIQVALFIVLATLVWVLPSLKLTSRGN